MRIRDRPPTPPPLGGVTQRRRDAPPLHAADGVASPKRQRRPPGHEPCARTLTTVAPPTGPLHGCTSTTRTDTSRTRTPLGVYSRALLLTSTRDSPAAARVALHTIAHALAHTPRRTAPRREREPGRAEADDRQIPALVVEGADDARVAADIVKVLSGSGQHVPAALQQLAHSARYRAVVR